MGAEGNPTTPGTITGTTSTTSGYFGDVNNNEDNGDDDDHVEMFLLMLWAFGVAVGD